LGQVWLWAARQEGDPAGIPSGVGAWRLQPSRLRVWLCRPSPQLTHPATLGLEKQGSLPCTRQLRAAVLNLTPSRQNGNQIGTPMTSTSPRTEQVLSTLRLHRGDWQKRFHVVDIGVFGSVARGDARPDSDVDVWVRLDPLTPYALVHLKQELETLLSTSVDVVRLRERMNPSLKQRILDEGLRP